MHAENLDLWTNYICSQSVPILNNSVQSILRICTDEHATCKQLADTIIRDPSVTARVLRIANSPYYNRSSTPLSDIRQAVLIIGFEKILSISLTVAIVDTLVKKDTMNHIVTLMIHSFQTAMLAKTVADILNLQHNDDIYVAGLLYDFGEIVFWSLSGTSGEAIHQQLENTHLPADMAQRELLGVTFDELTAELSSKWHLSPLLKTALLHPNRKDAYIECLVLSHTLIKSVDVEEEKYRQSLKQLAQLLKWSCQDTEDLVHQQYMETTKLSYYYLIYR